MTERETARRWMCEAVEGREGLCASGAHSEHPCTRPATELRWPDETEPALCTEHRRLIHLADEEESLRYALEKVEEFLAGPVKEDPHGALTSLGWQLLDDTRRKYARACAAVHAAEMVVYGSELEGLSREQHEELARLLLLSDGLGNARATLEDVGDEAFGAADRWVALHAVCQAAEAASRDLERYRKEIGLERPAPPQ